MRFCAQRSFQTDRYRNTKNSSPMLAVQLIFFSFIENGLSAIIFKKHLPCRVQFYHQNPFAIASTDSLRILFRRDLDNFSFPLDVILEILSVSLAKETTSR